MPTVFSFMRRAERQVTSYSLSETTLQLVKRNMYGFNVILIDVHRVIDDMTGKLEGSTLELSQQFP